MSRSSAKSARLFASIAVIGLVTALAWAVAATESGAPDSEARSAADKPAPKLFPVRINRPSGPPTVATGEVDYRGQPVSVACATCHATRTPDVTTHSTAQLDVFHQGLVIKHGSLSCLACHNRENYDTLQHADGRAIAFVDVMNLCAQCHGPQKRDYDHGSHGGMNGYWDRTRGPRTRNNCIDCHDPHAPAYPKVRPVFKPRDRGVVDSEKGGHHE